MWEPTTLECQIAAAVLLEYADRNGGKVPPRVPSRTGRARSSEWDVDKFIHNIFTLLAEGLEESDEIYPPWDGLTYKQHCAFWHIVKDYNWHTLGEYKEIINTASSLLESAREKYESRWMEWECRYVRKEIAKNLKLLADRREELLSTADAA